VNISSGSAVIGRPLLYGMSKGALNSFQAGAVDELAAHGVRINAVSPVRAAASLPGVITLAARTILAVISWMCFGCHSRGCRLSRVSDWLHGWTYHTGRHQLNRVLMPCKITRCEKWHPALLPGHDQHGAGGGRHSRV
jgi:hypothetical protein